MGETQNRPFQLSFTCCVRRRKLWMRVELGLWWIVIVTGVLTYYVWYEVTADEPFLFPTASGFAS